MSFTDLKEMLELQLSEVELLQCMFPASGEFCLHDQSTVLDVRSFIDDDAECSGPGDYGNAASQRSPTAPEDESGRMINLRQLSYSIKIKVSEEESASSNTELQLQCSIPLKYPNTMPELNVQSNSLSRQQYKHLNDDLQEHVQSLERGELCITEAIQWLQENALNYLRTVVTSKMEDESKQGRKQPTSFTRLWIHSHHIYSRSKREDIFAWSKERGLTGFSLPGKPGIICVEGPQGEVDEFWHKLRRLNWKKLTSKHREDVTIDGDDKEAFETTFKSLRHFPDFQEINFEVRGSRDYHMDLGQFFQYLEKHGCAEVFKILLGVDGRVSQKDAS